MSLYGQRCCACKRSESDAPKFITGAQANICTDCLKELLKSTVEIGDCDFCGSTPSARKPKSAPAVRICPACFSLAITIAQEFKTLPSKPTPPLIVSTTVRRRARTCQVFRPLEERQAFYQASIDALETRALDVYDGKHIAELLEIRASEQLCMFGRKWLEQFANDQDAPNLLASLIDYIPFEDFEHLAEYYLENAACDDLQNLSLAILKKDDKSLKSYDLIAARLEREPKNSVWASGLLNYRVESAAAEILALRWLELNAHEPRTHILSVCMSARNPLVIEALTVWIKQNPAANQMEFWMSLGSLLRTARNYNRESLPELITLARHWISKHKDSQDAGHVHACLIYASNESCDKEAAKEWYLKHRSASTAWRVLSELLSAPHNGDLVDEFAAQETKAILEKETPENRNHALAGIFLKVIRDSDSIHFARDLCLAQQSPWLLEDLLACAPDNELIEEAQGILVKWKGDGAGSKLLLALLNAEPQNSKTRELAEAWLACNRGHEDAAKVNALMARSL